MFNCSHLRNFNCLLVPKRIRMFFSFKYTGLKLLKILKDSKAIALKRLTFSDGSRDFINSDSGYPRRWGSWIQMTGALILKM